VKSFINDALIALISSKNNVIYWIA